MKLYIHLGLPKTGTTYLQECCFPHMAKPGYYLGKRLAASANTSAYSVLRDAVSRASVDPFQTRTLLERELSILESSQYAHCLYSEEMTLVDSGGLPWQQKLDRLRCLLEGLDVELILTVRHPSDALYSLFVELYPTLGIRARQPWRFALESNQARIFKFEELMGELGRAFPLAPLHLLPYDELQELDIRSPLLRRLSVTDIERRRVNTKQIGTSGEYMSNQISLRSLGARLPLRRQVRALVPPDLWRRMVTHVARVPISRGIAVPRFPESLSSRIGVLYQPSVDYLRDQHGVIVSPAQK